MNALPLLNASQGTLPLLVALVIGFGFGFVLERAGFGRAPKLAAQFYGYDMTVFKVMFTAIVTAMLGVVIAGELGWVDAHALSVGAVSETFVWPMLVGGFALGAGFIVSGYCPGTSIVAMASGHLDGLVTVIGVIIGSVAYSEAFPLFAKFHGSGNKGYFFLYEWLHVRPAIVAVAIALVALVLFVGVEMLERALEPRFAAVRCDAPPERPQRRAAFGFVGVAAAMALGLVFVGSGHPARAKPATGVRVEDLSRRVFTEPWTLRIIDVRSETECNKARVVGSECVPLNELGRIGLADAEGSRDLVIVAANDLPSLPPAAASYPGRAYVLSGGFPAWQRFALTKPAPPPLGASSDALSAYALRAGINQALTGQAAAAPVAAGGGYVPGKKKHGGGGCQ